MRSRGEDITTIFPLEITSSRYFKASRSSREATLSLGHTNTIGRPSRTNHCERGKSRALSENRTHDLRHAYSRTCWVAITL